MVTLFSRYKVLKVTYVINQIMNDRHIYDYANKLNMSLDERDPDMADDSQSFLKDQNQKFLKCAAFLLIILDAYQVSHAMHLERVQSVFL